MRLTREQRYKMQKALAKQKRMAKQLPAVLRRLGHCKALGEQFLAEKLKAEMAYRDLERRAVATLDLRPMWQQGADRMGLTLEISTTMLRLDREATAEMMARAMYKKTREVILTYGKVDRFAEGSNYKKEFEAMPRRNK